MELSAKDKKTSREIIETGLQKEYSKGLSDADSILSQWKAKTLNNREAYHSLFRQISVFDKHLARRYDGMTGSTYLFLIAGQLLDGIISENDLNQFSPEVKKAILLIANI
jgi:hypothetical protein